MILVLIRKFLIPGIRRPRKRLELKCDRCNDHFVTKFAKVIESQSHHFCSRKCSQAEHQHLRMAAAHTLESKAKRKATTIARFGVETVLSLPEVHALANTPEKCRQRHATMKKNGTYFTSKPEDQLFQHLRTRFKHVERQASVNQWPIDFYIRDIDTYVQLDGAYWHGLDRPLEEIAKFKTPRDRTILRKYQIDREQDEWFRSAGKRLLRITDRQFSRGELPDDFK